MTATHPKLQHHDLGTVYETTLDGPDFSSWAASTWDCPTCNSRILAVHVERMGSSPSETDPIPCPVCGDSSVRLYGAGGPMLTVMVEGSRRLTQQQAHKAFSLA